MVASRLASRVGCGDYVREGQRRRGGWLPDGGEIYRSLEDGDDVEVVRLKGGKGAQRLQAEAAMVDDGGG